ncbi:MAG: hypothetical protein GF353_05905 [Candidatus Lokiarchaeota archaeon]|nr:hypothetical protein [Candidatus Lokiarchaeota archaeon]
MAKMFLRLIYLMRNLKSEFVLFYKLLSRLFSSCLSFLKKEFIRFRLVLSSPNTSAVLNLILTGLLVWFTKSALNLTESIQIKEDSVRIGQKYKIAFETRDFALEYLNYCTEFVLRESNVILLINPQLSENDTIKDYIWFKPYEESLEVQSFLELPIVYDLMGIEMLNYFKSNPNLDQNVFGILDETEVKRFIALQKSVSQCTDNINRFLKRIRASYIATIKIYVKAENRDKIPKNHRFDPKTHIHKIWLNEARDKIKIVKNNANEFLSLFNSIGIDTLKFVLEVESSVPFHKRGELGNEPLPKHNSTIKLDSIYYVFDYFEYFINNRDTFQFFKNDAGIKTWYNRIN